VGAAAVAGALISALDRAKVRAEGAGLGGARRVPPGLAAHRIHRTHRGAACLVAARQAEVRLAAVAFGIAARGQVIRARSARHLDAHVVPRGVTAEDVLLADSDAAVAIVAAACRPLHEARA